MGSEIPQPWRRSLEIGQNAENDESFAEASEPGELPQPPSDII